MYFSYKYLTLHLYNLTLSPTYLHLSSAVLAGRHQMPRRAAQRRAARTDRRDAAKTNIQRDDDKAEPAPCSAVSIERSRPRAGASQRL